MSTKLVLPGGTPGHIADGYANPETTKAPLPRGF